MKVKKKPVTLIEIMIVMLILSLVSLVVVIGINKMIVDQKFNTEVSLIVNELRLAQDLMMVLKVDVHLIFEENHVHKGIDYGLEIDAPLQQNLKNEIQKRKKMLKTIKGVFFKDELEKKEVSGRLDIKFLSGGAIMSKGIIQLLSTDDEKNKDKGLQNYISLLGYPHPIKSFDTVEESNRFFEVDDLIFDVLLTEDTVLKARDIKG